MPKVPRAVSFTAHWLAIEGVQPSIPQNPLPSEVKALPPQIRGSQKNYSSSALADDVEVKPLVKHVISKELQLYFDRVVEALLNNDDDDDETDANNSSAGNLRNIALNSLRNDPGLHQLVPYLVQFVQEQISLALKTKLSIIHTMLEVIHAMILNDTIYIEPYIHQIMPCLLTPLLSKRVGPSGAPTTSSFAIRDFAASLLKKICESYSESYYSLLPRVTRTLLKGFLDANRSVASWYGSIVGIRGLGAEVVSVVILGNARPWYEGTMPRVANKEDQVLLTQAVIDSLRELKHQAPALTAEKPLDNEEKEKVKGLIGEKLFEELEKESDAITIARGILVNKL